MAKKTEKKWYAYLFRENIYGLGIQAVTFLAGILSTFIFPNILGKDGFGYYSLVLGVATIGVWVADFGVQGALLRFIPEGVKNGIARKYFIEAFKWKLLSALGISAICFLAADNIAGIYNLPPLAEGIRVGALFLFFYSFSQFFETLFISLKEARNSLILSSLFNFGRVLLPVLVFFIYRQDYIGILMGVAVACAISVLTGATFALRNPTLAKTEDKEPNFAALKSYMIYCAIGAIVYILMQWSDTLILGLFRPISDVAIYRVAWLWANATLLLFPFPGRIFMPAYVYENTERSKRMFGLTLRYGFVFAFLMISGVILVSAQFLNLFYKGNYNDAYPIMVVLSLLTFELMLKNIAEGLLAGKDMVKITTYASIVATTAQILLLFLLAPSFGVLGAAVAVTAHRVLVAVLETIIAARFISMRIPLSYVWKPALCTLATIAFLLPVWQHTFSLPAAIAYGAAVVAIYGLAAVVLRAVDIGEIVGIVRGSIRR